MECMWPEPASTMSWQLRHNWLIYIFAKTLPLSRRSNQPNQTKFSVLPTHSSISLSLSLSLCVISKKEKWHQCQLWQSTSWCSWGTSQWARPASSPASCTTSSTTPIRLLLFSTTHQIPLFNLPDHGLLYVWANPDHTFFADWSICWKLFAFIVSGSVCFVFFFFFFVISLFLSWILYIIDFPIRTYIPVI
jgi:hypothetical protein